MPRTTSAGKRKIGTKFIAFLILLVPLPTMTVLFLVPDLVRPSKQFISCVPQKATGVTDRRWVQAMGKPLRSKAPFPGSKQDPRVLHPCRHCNHWQLGLRMPRLMWQKETWALQNHNSTPATCKDAGLGGGTKLQWSNLPQPLLN